MLISGDGSSLLAEAMKEGKVKVSVIKVIIVGTAGVGKTCVYHLLLGLPPPDPKKRTSTECATRPVRVIQIVGGKEDEKWEKADLKKMVTEAVPILCRRLRRYAQQKDVGDDDDGEIEKAEGEENAPKINMTPLQKAIEDIVIGLQELVTQYVSKRGLYFDPQQLSMEKQAIYLTDSGGQQAFWDLAPIFMHGCSTIIFVHRLCDKLEEKPLNEMYKEGQMIGPSQRATLTTAEAFKLMCQGLESDKSKVTVIGTHRDCYKAEEQHEETVTDKNTKLGNCIPDDSKVFCDKDMTKVIYELNAAHPKKEDKDIARVIREKVEESAHRPEVPISWYILQIVLEEVAKKLGRQVFSISECETVASELSFDMEEMKEALRFFDQLNIFFYKEDIVPDTVFTSSQVPLNAVTKLVEKRYMLLKPNDHSGPIAIDGIWKKFRDQAKIQIEHLQDEIFKPHYVQDKFTEETFLRMLENLLIVAPINDTKEYFCPTLLETVEVDGFLKKDDIATRVVHFPGGYAPPGVFCCAVCHLVAKKNWKIREQDVVARNQITFAVEGSKVTFIDKLQFFAVAIEREDVDQGFCTNINIALYKAIKHALEITNKQETLFELSFLCPCTKHEAPHPATVGHNFRLICTKEDLKSGTLNDQQKIWPNLPCSGICHTNVKL